MRRDKLSEVINGMRSPTAHPVTPIQFISTLRPSLRRHMIAVALDPIVLVDKHQLRFEAGADFRFVDLGEGGDDDQVAQLRATGG